MSRIHRTKEQPKNFLEVLGSREAVDGLIVSLEPGFMAFVESGAIKTKRYTTRIGHYPQGKFRHFR